MSKKLKIAKNRYWKNEIDYHNKLSKEEKAFLRDFANTEYSNAPHPNYSPEDMKEVYNNTNSANRCLMSNAHYPDCPSTHHDSEVIGKGKDYEDIMLDLENIEEQKPDELETLWKQDFKLAYEFLMDMYANMPLTQPSLISFFIKMNNLLRWEKIDRNKHKST